MPSCCILIAMVKFFSDIFTLEKVKDSEIDELVLGLVLLNNPFPRKKKRHIKVIPTNIEIKLPAKVDNFSLFPIDICIEVPKISIS